MIFSFGMFFRLFAIAGMTWLLEIVSHIVTLINSDMKIISDIISIIITGQGVLMFFVTLWKRDLLKSFQKK
ncbi:hypothetical protein KR093_004124 [Drosophila rubida]|uniref:Uncharacterized protein n=1 Tax=Drosophila rubida TaxID=30044 RepID=A0AAD4K8T4_9MUSC|nr:hypothetical protein KR093_004124 [Drosophila rubida]